MATQHSPLKVLIVEDDPGICETLRVFLGEEGYEVFLAENGLKALEIIEEGIIPSLVITDVLMPEMDGYQLCHILRKEKSLPVIPFLFLTALSQPEDRMNGYLAGADDYMTKPFDLDDLALKVKTLIDLQMHKKPQAVFCAALNGVATWMTGDDSPRPNCLNKGQCDPEVREKSCALNLAYPV